jgi:hypothetical protein
VRPEPRFSISGPHAPHYILLRNQLLVAFAAVIVVFGVGVVVAIAHLGSVSNTLQNGTERVKMADALSKDTYNMQGSQLMATLNNGASAGDHEGDVQRFAEELTAVKPHMTTAADRSAYSAIQKDFADWKVLDSRAMTLAKAHHKAEATALVTGAQRRHRRASTHATDLAPHPKGARRTLPQQGPATLTARARPDRYRAGHRRVVLLSRRIVYGCARCPAAKNLTRRVDQPRGARPR